MKYLKHTFSYSKLPAWLIAALLMTLTSTTSDAQSIREQLKNQLPSVIEYCNKNGIKTVGVLKFRTKKPNEKLSDSAGPINSLLADRIECGLILANPFDESKQLNVVKHASDQMLGIKGANHLTQEGRQICFDKELEIAWGCLLYTSPSPRDRG